MLIKKEDLYRKKKLWKEAIKTEDFIWIENGFLKGRLLSKRKSWIGQGRVFFESSLIDKEESHLAREEKRN